MNTELYCIAILTHTISFLLWMTKTIILLYKNYIHADYISIASYCYNNLLYNYIIWIHLVITCTYVWYTFFKLFSSEHEPNIYIHTLTTKYTSMPFVPNP